MACTRRVRQAPGRRRLILVRDREPRYDSQSFPLYPGRLHRWRHPDDPRRRGVVRRARAGGEQRLGEESLAQVIRLEGDEVSLQVFAGGRGISTGSRVRFLGHPMDVPVSRHVLGRVFGGSGRPIDGRPSLDGQRHEAVGGPSVNPTTRGLPQSMIRTGIPMIDLFNCLVESQKIPIFSVAGEPYNRLAGPDRRPGRGRHHRLRRARVGLRRLPLLPRELRGGGHHGFDRPCSSTWPPTRSSSACWSRHGAQGGRALRGRGQARSWSC
jgi:hypothetical protein